MSEHVLPAGLPAPVPTGDGLDGAYWEGTRNHQLWVQRCRACGTWQWGPEWLCHECHSFDVGWEQVAAEGRIYSWERPWHPVHPALADSVPYVVLLVELPTRAACVWSATCMATRWPNSPSVTPSPPRSRITTTRRRHTRSSNGR